MIDLNLTAHEFGRPELASTFFAAVMRELRATARMSTTVRVTVGGDRIDFRITYVGPSRPRREARRLR